MNADGSGLHEIIEGEESFNTEPYWSRDGSNRISFNRMNVKEAGPYWNDFDGRPEIRLANEKIVAWVSAHKGGHIYELDLSSIGHNLGATMQRRPEVYHNKVREGQTEDNEETSSIHDRVVFKQEGLEDRLQYDHRLRTCLIDHFWDETVDVQAIADNTAMERGDFADGPYQAKIRRNPGRVQILMTRQGNAWGIPLTITKGHQGPSSATKNRM